MAIYTSAKTPLSVLGNTTTSSHIEAYLQLIEHIRHGSIQVTFYNSHPTKKTKPVTSFKAGDAIWISLCRPGTEEEARKIGKRYANSFIGTALLKKAQKGIPFVFDTELRRMFVDKIQSLTHIDWFNSSDGSKPHLVTRKSVTTQHIINHFLAGKDYFYKEFLGFFKRGRSSIEHHIAYQIEFGDAIFVRILPTYERNQILKIARLVDKHNYRWISLLPHEALDDDELFRKLIRINPHMLEYATQRVKSIRDIALHVLDMVKGHKSLDWRPYSIEELHTPKVAAMVHASSEDEFCHKLDILKRRWSIHDKLMQDLAVDHEEDDQPTFTKI